MLVPTITENSGWGKGLFMCVCQREFFFLKKQKPGFLFWFGFLSFVFVCLFLSFPVLSCLSYVHALLPSRPRALIPGEERLLL